MKFSPFLRPRPPEHDDARLGEHRAVGLGLVELDELRLAARRVDAGRDLLDRALAALRGGVEGRGAHRDDLRRALDRDRGDHVAGVHRTLEGAVVVDAGDVARPCRRRAARPRAAAGPCRPRVAVATTASMPLSFDELGERRGVGVGDVVLERRVVDGEDLLHAVRRRARWRARRCPCRGRRRDTRRRSCRRRPCRRRSPTSVVLGNFPCWCSAKTRTLPMCSMLRRSDDLRFVVQDLHQLLHRADLACRPARFGGGSSLTIFTFGVDVDAEARRPGSPSAPSCAPS